MNLKITAMDPLLPSPCLLCGERFEPEGYSERFRSQIVPGILADGFAPALLVEDKPAGFVCPECFGDGKENLARSMERGAERLRELAGILERGEKA